MAARRFDGVAAIARLRAARLPVIAVAQHDDQLTRRRALAAGASRVFSYNKFFTRRPAPRGRPGSGRRRRAARGSVRRRRHRRIRPRERRHQQRTLSGAPRRSPRRRCVARASRACSWASGRSSSGWWATRPSATSGSNLLVVPASGPVAFLGPRLELAAAEQAPGLGGGSVRLETWEETRRPLSAVCRRCCRRPAVVGRWAASQVLVSDGLRAAFLLGLQRVLPGVAWGLASRALAPLRRSKDAEELALLRAGRRGRGPRHRGHRRRPARGPLRGRRRQRGSRAARGRGPRHGRVRHRRLRARTAPRPTTSRASGSSAPASRCSSTSAVAARGLLLGHDAHVLAGRRGRPRPDPAFVAIHRLTEEAQAAGTRRRPPGARVRDPRCRGPRRHQRRAATASTSSTGSATASAWRSTRSPTSSSTSQDVLRVGRHLQHRAGHLPRGPPSACASRTSWSCTAEGGESLNSSGRSLRVIEGR